ncbi:MAG: hypothetical protein ACKV2T_26970 [Kofleriaceae bacterium]
MMTRKQFLRSVLGIGAGVGAVAFISACGDDGGSAVDAGNTCTNPVNQIGSNHGHALAIPIADVNAGAAQTYNLTGGAHAHTLAISATQFTQIKNGQTLNIATSTGAAHTHMVTIMCVS